MGNTVLRNGYYDVPLGKLTSVVTILEMQAPAPLRPSTVPEGFRFEHMPNAGLDWYRDLFNRVGGHDWLWLSRLKLGDAELSAILSDPKVDFYALTKDGRAEGLLELDFRESGACELAFFGVTSALIGPGAGRFLMNEAITRAWAQPIDHFHVHTCTLDHPDALPFYVRSGFTPIRQQVEIDDDPRVTGDFPTTAGPRTPMFS
jgi:N-acetylglutamate synthase-like GNAT family acetyltransferase